MTLLEQCQAWHNHGDYEKIIAAIEEIPAAERTPELDGELARAYNNVAQPSEWWYFQKAIDLLAPHAEDSADDHVWNFRMGYAYYYLDQENRALPYFETALAALPGDEDTEQMIEDCRRGLSLPLFSRPFRIRVQEAWLAFSEAEEELRALMDAGSDHGEELIERCSSALHIAFDDLSFELGKGGEKYELILTPEGMRAKLFPLVYFARHAPASVREHWDIHVGRTASLGFALRTDDYTIEMTDVAVWFAPDGDGIALTVYCEKLLPLLRENENRAWWMLSTIVDQALGEIAAIRLIHDFDLLDAPREEPSTLLADLPQALEAAGYSLANDAEEYLDHYYLAYEREPDTSDDADLRLDVYAGSTRLPSLLSSYMDSDATLVDIYHADGIAAGFIAYPLTDEMRESADEILDFRDALMQAIEEETDCLHAVTFLGGATGTNYGYLDFLAWDLHAVLVAAETVLKRTNLPWAVFHSFRRDAAGTVNIFDRDEEEEDAAAPESSDTEKGPLLTAEAVAKLEAMEDGSTGYFFKMLSYLNKYIKNGIIKGRFTREEAHRDRDIALWYAYACNNVDLYPYYYRAIQWMPDSEPNAHGCGTWYYRYAVALMHCGYLEKALRYAAQGTREEPDYPWCYLELGKLRAHFGDRDGALDAVRQGLSLVPDDHEFLTLEREIEEGATIEQMCFHWVDGAYDEELQQASRAAELPQEGAAADALDDMYQKQRSILCIRVDEEGLSRVLRLFSPISAGSYTRNAPYCHFPRKAGDTEVEIVFRMNEAGMSKLPLTWLTEVRDHIDSGAWVKHTDEHGTAQLTAVHILLDRTVVLEYKYPWKEKSAYFEVDADWNVGERKG